MDCASFLKLSEVQGSTHAKTSVLLLNKGVAESSRIRYAGGRVCKTVPQSETNPQGMPSNMMTMFLIPPRRTSHESSAYRTASRHHAGTSFLCRKQARTRDSPFRPDHRSGRHPGNGDALRKGQTTTNKKEKTKKEKEKPTRPLC